MIGIGLWLQRPWYVSVLTEYTDAVHSRCLSAVQLRIQDLEFPAPTHPISEEEMPLAHTSVVVKKLPLERIYKKLNVTLPCIIITPGKTTASPTEGVNARDDYRRPCLVTVVMPDNAENTLELNLDIALLWQEKIMRAFHNQRLAGVPEVVICQAEPAESVIPAAWGNNVLASAVLLRFRSREARGLT